MEEGEMSDGANSSASSRSRHSKHASRDGSQPKPETSKNAEIARSFSSSRSRSSSSRSSRSRHRHSASKSRSRSRSNHRRSRKHHKHGHKHSKSRSRSGGHRRGSRHHRRYRDSRSRSRSGGRSYRRDDYRGSKRRSTTRSPTSGRRRNVGDRDHPIESKCLGIFGLSLYTSERDLTEVFSRFGPIEKVQMVYDYHTGKSRGFAFVYMKHIDDAVEAKESAPGMEIDGHKIRVDYSITERAHTPTPGQYLGRTGGGGFMSRRLPYTSKRTGHRSMSRSRSRSYSPRRY